MIHGPVSIPKLPFTIRVTLGMLFKPSCLFSHLSQEK